MKVNIQTQRFDADSKLIALIEKKIDKLGQFHDRITKINVFLRLDNVAHRIKDKIVEIHVLVPRSVLFVRQTSKSFEGSFELALDAMINRMKREKQRM